MLVYDRSSLRFREVSTCEGSAAIAPESEGDLIEGEPSTDVGPTGDPFTIYNWALAF